MTDVDREQLRRDCSDALEALLRHQRMEGLAELAETLRVLGPPYRSHGELMHGAVRDGQENAITWHLIHDVKQHLAETRVAVSAVLSLSHGLVQQIDGLLPTLHDKSAADAQALEEIASLMRREGSLAQLLTRVEGALARSVRLPDAAVRHVQ